MKRLLFAAATAFCFFTLPHAQAEDITPPAAISATALAPEIVSVRGRTVTVRVPEGYGRVTLERLSGKVRGWTAFATQSWSGAAGDVVFKIKTPVSRRLLRVRGTRAEPLPESFLLGRSDFLAPKGFTPSDVSLPYAYTTFATASDNALSLASGAAVGDSSRAVVEGDIWKHAGDRLYFFNQYRGLQVLDVSDPAQPAMLGQLRMPVSGKEMYVFGEHVALILPRWQWWNDSAPGSELSICSVADGKPVEIARLPIEGTPIESRMVGTALYVAANRTILEANIYRNITVVTGFDLSNPANPVQRNVIEIKPSEYYAWASAVWSDNRYFVVANQTYSGNQSSTHLSLIDVSNPDGTVVRRGTAFIKGYVQKKFNIHANGDVLSAVSDYSSWILSNGQRESYAHLENFDISNPDSPKSIGELDMGHGEMVRAVRYDSDRVYVVTAIRMDPLWIVNNAEAAHPKLVSHLEVPGWSTFIEPMGDRLVTVGVMPSEGAESIWNTRVAVSLYDVANPAKPRLLSQLPVGGNFSNSEANWDEKAFSVLPEDGLILVPYTDGYGIWRWNGWQTGSSSTGIQIVDLERNALKLRGVISHEFTPRRSATHKGSVLSLSDRDLLSVDITDRDHPVVKADIELAWNVNRVWRVGDYLLQLDKGSSSYYFGTSTSGQLTISPANDPERSISVVGLGDEPVLGADVKDGLLTVLSRVAISQKQGVIIKPGLLRQPLRLTVYDVTSLPQVVKKGSVLARDKGGEFGWGSYEAEMLWPAPGTLVAAISDPGFSISYGIPIFSIGTTLTLNAAVANTSGSLVASSIFPWPGYYTTTSKRLVAFDVGNPRAPRHVSTVQLGKNSSYSFSPSIVAGGRVFTSSQDYRQQRHYLDVVDFFVPGASVVADSISFPGVLFASGRDGALLYARGPEYDTDGHADAWYSQNSIHAVSFDGKSARLLDSIDDHYNINLAPLSGDTLFVPRFYDEVDNDRIESWQLGNDARFIKVGEVAVPGRNWPFFSVCNDVLVESDQGHLHFWDITNPASLLPLNAGPQQSSWPNISNAIGNKTDGLFIPAGWNGVEAVSFQ